jgi:tetratricopeptide (TPR) repeat protein
MPPAEQVRAQMEKILASDVFARSGRARDLLKYIVEQDLAGNADRLKGYAIAVDVFGKGPDFDPANDTVVRVQMGRLRDILALYYQRHGTQDDLRITIPRGSYVPIYSPNGDAAEATKPDDGKADADRRATPEPGGQAETAPAAVIGAADTETVVRRSRSPAGLLAAALAAVAAIVIGLVAYQWSIAPAQAPEAVAESGVGSPVGFLEMTGSVPHEALPLIYLDVGPDDPIQRVATVLRRGIAGFDTVTLIARPPTPDVQGAHLRTDFVFALRDQADGSVLLEVHNVLSGKVLMSRIIDVADGSPRALDDQIADTLSSVIPASGVIYAAIVEAGAQTTLVRCLVLNDQFYREQQAAAHEAAYRCMEEMVGAGSTSPLVYSELGSLHIQAIHNRYAYPLNASPEKALEYARQAVQYGPNSPYAHRSMGYVLSRTASAAESLRWMQKAYELNTFDLGMAASFGYAQVFAGNYRDGTPILQRAVNAASAHPTWWDYGLFLGHFMNGDVDAAANAVSALAASDRAHYVAARLIAASALDQHDAATSLVKQLIANHKTFAADPLAFYRKASYPPEMGERLAAALREAGLGGAS